MKAKHSKIHNHSQHTHTPHFVDLKRNGIAGNSEDTRTRIQLPTQQLPTRGSRQLLREKDCAQEHGLHKWGEIGKRCAIH